MTDDGVIEKGVGHVHPAFTEIKPRGVERVATLISEEMLKRAGNRARNYQLWGIGEPFKGQAAQSIQIPIERVGTSLGFPPFTGDTTAWTPESLTKSVSEVIVATITCNGESHNGR